MGKSLKTTSNVKKPLTRGGLSKALNTFMVFWHRPIFDHGGEPLEGAVHLPGFRKWPFPNEGDFGVIKKRAFPN